MKIHVSKREAEVESDTDVPSSFLPLFQAIKVTIVYVLFYFHFLLFSFSSSTLPHVFLLSLQVNSKAQVHRCYESANDSS